MINNSTQNLTEGKFLIQEFKNSVSYIQENWTDDIGRNFVRFLQNTEMELNKYERRRTALLEKISELTKMLNDMDDDPKSPKTKMYYSPHESSYNSGKRR